AVSATVAQVLGVLAGARERLGATGRRTILFLDEIHRFNKAQQDALLPGVEEGVITLIGATTENPYMEVNSALLSRAQVYALESLSIEDLETVARRGAAELGVEIPDDLLRLIATRAGGDARSVHNIVELAVQTAQAAGEPLAEAHVDDAARKRPLVYDKAADAHYDFISAFIKSMRGSDPDASVYYLAAMLESGEDARYIARRLNLSQAAIYLALAPKSNASYEAIKRATLDVQERGNIRPPKSLRDGSYYGRKLGHGEGYVYPHSDPAGFDVDNLPDELKGTTYYEPSGNGEESKDPD